MRTQPHEARELIQARVQRLIRHLDSVFSIVEIALFVFFIATVAQIFSLQVRSVGFPEGLDWSEFKRLIPLAVIGAAGIVVLSSTIFVFVHFLRGKTKKLQGLEVKVVTAFMKALDESPLESHALDDKYREQLNP